jgi:hypothetical protein
MYSYGYTPFANLEPRDVLPYLQEGKRLALPDNCPNDM